MKYAENLAEVERSIAGCLHCNSCHYGHWPENHEICPIYSYDNVFTHSAGGLMFLAKALLRNQMEYTQHLSELVYTCSACRGCDDQCMMMRSANAYMPLSDLIRLMKYEMVKRGLVPERIKSMRKKVEETGDLTGSAKAAQPFVPDSIRDDDADTVLYGECFHGGKQAEVFGSAVNLLEKMKQPVALFSEGGCCGSSLFDHGFWDELPALVESKSKKMNAFKDRTFVYVNPHCQEFTTNHYQLIASDHKPVKGRHISEVITDALKDDRLKKKKGEKVKVTYHDPCMLSRGLGITEPPREVLASFDDVEVVEMKRNRENSFCCGSKAAGTYFDDFRESTARERLREFEQTGADLLITACHYCKTMFRQALGSDKDRVKDLCQFVDERTA
jgi:heterodisulfide reductase subunit D